MSVAVAVAVSVAVAVAVTVAVAVAVACCWLCLYPRLSRQEREGEKSTGRGTTGHVERNRKRDAYDINIYTAEEQRRTGAGTGAGIGLGT